MIIKNFNYNLKEITAISVQKSTIPYLWVSFKKNSSGYCVLKKVSSNNPLQSIYSMNMSVDNITKLYASDNLEKVYIAVDNTTYFAYVKDINYPLSTEAKTLIPSGVTEKANSIVESNSEIYFLLPGENSNNSKVVIYTEYLSLITILELTGVHNTYSMTVDTSDNIWITSNVSPGKLIRVYFDTTYQYEIIPLG